MREDRRGGRYSDSRPYYEEVPAENSDEQVKTGVFASLLDKLTGKQEAPKPAKPKKPAPAPVVREVRPVEKEKMTEELRAALAGQLANARYFLESVRAVPEPDKKAANADKISKVRARAAELKRDLKGVEQELTTTDDAARARGKVAEVVKKAGRSAGEISRLQNGREDWPDRYKIFMARLGEVAKAQDVALDESTLDKIRPKIAELAKRKGEAVDLDGEVETIIIDSI